MKAFAAFTVFLLLAPARGFAAEPSGSERGGNPPLRMEELEVRGFRETPEILYLPLHRGIELPSPVRYDLFLDDVEQPVFPREISPGTPPAASTFAPRGAP
jgi:hypothetical protein